MRIYIKIRFNSSYPKFEKVLDNRYVLYIPEPQTEESEDFIKELLSRKLGVIKDKVYFVTEDKKNGWIFDLDV